MKRSDFYGDSGPGVSVDPTPSLVAASGETAIDYMPVAGILALIALLVAARLIYSGLPRVA